MSYMLEQLFGSKTRLKLLKMFLLQPEAKFYVRELTRELDVQINAVRRELETLMLLGLIEEVKFSKSTEKGRRNNQKKFYQANPQAIVYSELRALLLKSQRLGEREMTDLIVERGGDIALFILTGRFVDKDNVPSDMLIVGDVKAAQVAKLVEEYEQEVGFEIRYTILTVQEYEDRKHVMDKFLFTLLEGPVIKVIDELSF